MVEEVSTVLSEVVGKRLLGELLTVVDSSVSDRVQRDAMKSLVRQDVQKCLAELTARLTASKEVGKKATKKVEEDLGGKSPTSET